MRNRRMNKWVMLMVIVALTATPLTVFGAGNIYTHAEGGGFEPVTVSGASYYPLDDSLIYDAGPGLYTTPLVIPGGEHLGTTEDFVEVGQTEVWNTREEICVSIQTDDAWDLSQVYIYLGYEDVPMSSDGTPKVGEFPYVETFSGPMDSYELVANLEDEFEFTWGKWDRENRVWHVVVYAKVVEEDGDPLGQKSVHEEACAEGLHAFENRWGWYSDYLLVHPETGHVIDAPVGGLDFDTSSHSGKTDANGAFDYIPGENVTLSIGDLPIGTVEAQHKITPMDLIGTENMEDVRVINMARILQTLDSDQSPKRGIDIQSEATESLNAAMAEIGLTRLDFEDTEAVEDLLLRTVEIAASQGTSLRMVSMEEAYDNLEKGTQSNVFRKNISKTPEALTTKAKLELMPVYVPAQKANGEHIYIDYYDEDDKLVEQRTVVTPLVVTYTDEVPGTGASDVFAAISRDEGSTWKITNLSRSAGRSSFTLADGTEYPGDVKKPMCKVAGNYILVAWTSKFARSGRPRYAITTGEGDEYIYDNDYYAEDIFGVGGPQRSHDYTEDGYPEVGELPFSAVWSCRGVIDPDTGEISWYKPERLTSGRRDAYQLMFSAKADAGFALVWQEDPEGLRPGSCAGPGEGWSGATTNHKTDIWYSYVMWDDFATVDEHFDSGGEPQNGAIALDGREKVLVPFSMPVRISDNDVVNYENLKWFDEDAKAFDSIENTSGRTEGTHLYGYMIPGLIFPEGMFSLDENGQYFDREEVIAALKAMADEVGEDQVEEELKERYFHYKLNNQNDSKYVAITQDGRVLSGATGASRPNIMIQPYTNSDGEKSAWVVVAYEETKGMGSGPPTDGEDSISENESGTGEGAGADKYFPDLGKNVIYHSFDIENPDVVSAGHIMNPQERDEDGYLVYVKDNEGNLMLDESGNKIPAYENARRPRLIIQSKKMATDGKADDEKGTVLVCLFKMGEDGQGRASDILMTRFMASRNDKGNPYDWKYVVKDDNGEPVWQNISSVTEGATAVAKGVNEADEFGGKRDPVKVITWSQTDENLSDGTSDNPYDDARAHRGIIRGDFLAIAYCWTPNWAPARNGNDHYDLYIRRSFDGGATWTTDPEGGETEYLTINSRQIPITDASTEKVAFTERTVTEVLQAGDFEPARNVSMLRNNKESVIEPRLVGTPGTILTDGVPLFDEDKRNTDVFWVTYGTESNPGRNADEMSEPMDIYYSYTQDRGETYVQVTTDIKADSLGGNGGGTKTEWDWLAKDTGMHKAAQAECQIRMKPDGLTFYSVWNETGLDGSDVVFRKISSDGVYGQGAEMVPGDIVSPTIMVSGVGDGDVSSDNVLLDIELNEPGTFEAELYKNEVLYETLSSPIDPYYEIIAQAQTDEYRLEVFAEDNAGNESTLTMIFTLDSRLPVITIEGVTDGETTMDSRTVTVSHTGDELELTLWKDGVLEETFTNGDTIEADGYYILEAVSTNVESSLQASRRVEWTIDLVSPEISIEGIEEGQTYYESVTPEIVVTDNHSRYSDLQIDMTLDGATYVSGQAIEEPGGHVLVVEATDLAGHSSYERRGFRIEDSNNSSTGPASKEEPLTPEEVSPTVIINGVETTSIPVSENLTLYMPLSLEEYDMTLTIWPTDGTLELPDNAVMICDEIYDIELRDEDGNLVETFDEPITFTYGCGDISQGEMKDLKDIKISYWDETLEEWVAMPTDFDASTRLLTASTYHLSRFSIMDRVDFPAFEDIKGNRIEELVYKMASLGIVDGDENGNFRASDLITREEIIKLLVVASGEQPDESFDLGFGDQEEISDWAKGYICKAVEQGWLVGYEDHTVRAGQVATGNEGASMIAGMCRMLGINTQRGRPEGAGNRSGWAQGYIDELVTIGVIDESDDLSRPMTRADAVEMIMRYLDQLNK